MSAHLQRIEELTYLMEVREGVRPAWVQGFRSMSDYFTELLSRPPQTLEVVESPERGRGNGNLLRIEALTHQLEMEEKRFEAIAEFSTDGYWDWHIPSKAEYYSPRFWEILGYDPSSFPHHEDSWKKVIHPDDLKLVEKNFQRHVETRGEHPYRQKVRYRHADGRWVWVLCRGKVIEWTEASEPVRMVGTHTLLDSES